MIYGHLHHSESFRALLQHPIWAAAFEALHSLDKDTLLGITELGEPRFTLNVHEYNTLPREQCRFECHKQTVDLQYLISGGEEIDWEPRWTMNPDGANDLQRDFQYLQSPESPSGSKLHLTAGFFAIFFPSDAHRPKINDLHHPSVYKAVVKIPTTLLNSPL